MFRIDGSISLSHLLLSQSEESPSYHGGRILIAIDVKDAEAYHTAIDPFVTTHGDGGMLKFSVNDLIKRKEPTGNSTPILPSRMSMPGGGYLIDEDASTPARPVIPNFDTPTPPPAQPQVVPNSSTARPSPMDTEEHYDSDRSRAAAVEDPFADDFGHMWGTPRHGLGRPHSHRHSHQHGRPHHRHHRHGEHEAAHSHDEEAHDRPSRRERGGHRHSMFGEGTPRVSEPWSSGLNAVSDFLSSLPPPIPPMHPGAFNPPPPPPPLVPQPTHRGAPLRSNPFFAPPPPTSANQHPLHRPAFPPMPFGMPPVVFQPTAPLHFPGPSSSRAPDAPPFVAEWYKRRQERTEPSEESNNRESWTRPPHWARPSSSPPPLPMKEQDVVMEQSSPVGDNVASVPVQTPAQTQTAVPTLHTMTSRSSFASTASGASNISSASTVQDEVKDMLHSFVDQLNNTLARNNMSELTLVPTANAAPTRGGDDEKMEVDDSEESDKEVRAEKVESKGKEIPGIHPNIICDNCTKAIVGVRYKVR